MTGSRLNAALCTLALFAAGCGRSAAPPPPAPSGPSLADQLTAAKELVAIAEEKHLQAIRNREEAMALWHQIDEADVETKERFGKTVDQLTNREFEAEMELKQAKARVRQLASSMTAE